jgi:glycosyltransferase involved in cell wall biosynthesis
MPQVSVIIPTYNRCNALKKAIQSVFNQTYQDFEILVIDDGSTDPTPKYLSTINDLRFHFVTFGINRGGNTARNEGIKLAQGEYLAFLDDDDCWISTKLEKQIQCIKSDNIDLCYTGLNVYTFKEKLIKYVYRKPKYNDPYKSIMNDNFLGGSSSIFVKKQCVKEVGCFDTNLPALQDWDLLIRLFKNGCTIRGINLPLVSYYIVDVNKSITCSHKSYKQAVDYLLNKYQMDPYIHLFRQRLKIIEIKRLFKSKRFFFDSIKYYFKRFVFKN